MGRQSTDTFYGRVGPQGRVGDLPLFAQTAAPAPQEECKPAAVPLHLPPEALEVAAAVANRVGRGMALTTLEIARRCPALAGLPAGKQDSRVRELVRTHLELWPYVIVTGDAGFWRADTPEEIAAAAANLMARADALLGRIQSLGHLVARHSPAVAHQVPDPAAVEQLRGHLRGTRATRQGHSAQ